MKKRILICTVAFVLLLAVTASVTLAYLTDTDSAVNVMTSGKITIELIEQQRNDAGDALEPFEQNKMLLPIVGSAQGEKDGFGLPTAANYLDKVITVENTGKNDAYVRVLVAIPAALENIENEQYDSDNALHTNLGNRVDLTGAGTYNNMTGAESLAGWNWDLTDLGTDLNGDAKPDGTYFDTQMEIDGELYNVYCYTYKDALKPGDTTRALFSGAYLDSRVDYDDDTDTWTFDGTAIDYDLSKGVIIPVFAQAVQADGFDSPFHAFTESFGMGTSITNPWANTVMVDNETELVSALENGGTVVLTDNIELTKGLYITKSVTLDGNGFELTGEPVYVNKTAAVVTIKNVTFSNALDNFASGDGKSSLYATNGYAGRLVIKDCTFNAVAYENIQIVPAEGAHIVVDGNVFADAAQGQYRMLHIEAAKNNTNKDVTIKVTGNTFGNADGLANSAVDIDYVAEDDLTVENNVLDASFVTDATSTSLDIYICDQNGVMLTDSIANFTK